MNETYPNISVNGVRLSSDSSSRGTASTKSTESPREREHVQARVGCFRARSNRFNPGSVERACVRTVRNCHSPRRLPRVRGGYFRMVCGKKLSRGRGKIEVPQRMSFRGLRLLSHWLHTKRMRILKKKCFPITTGYNLENCICTVWFVHLNVISFVFLINRITQEQNMMSTFFFIFWGTYV